jgi:hypothetical protein
VQQRKRADHELRRSGKRHHSAKMTAAEILMSNGASEMSWRNFGPLCEGRQFLA